MDCGCGTRNSGDVGLDSYRWEGIDVLADAHFLPFRNQTFEGCNAFALLEHVNNPFQVLREIHRVLKTSGTLNILLPRGSRMLPFIVKEVLLLRWRDCWTVYKGLRRGMHKWQFSIKSVRFILLQTGFQVLLVRHRLDHRVPFTGNIVASAKKLEEN